MAKDNRRNFNFDDATSQLLDKLAGARSLTATATIAAALKAFAALEFPPIKAGYIKLDRLGEMEPVCHECDQPLNGKAYMIVMSDGTLRGPACDSCASSE